MTQSFQAPRRTRNWKLTLAYDGTDFSGWQIQPGERTVQGELQAALRRVTGEGPLPQGSGRTDAGVHALGQVASFELHADIPASNLLRALNRTLPPAIRIVAGNRVPASFHARHSAVAKTYEYRVFRNPICPPFLARYVHYCPWPMNLELLQKAALLFKGEHNFLSFAATDPDLTARQLAEKKAAHRLAIGQPATEEPALTASLGSLPPPGKRGAIRTVLSSTWDQHISNEGPYLVYRVRGNGFLHHMVRNLVGTMLDVGRGYTELAAIPAMLDARSRAAAGPTAPAQGLFLYSVDYAPQDDPPSEIAPA